jgi:hypothetical protein
MKQINLQDLQCELIKEKEGMVQYLLLKVKKEDWHGVADAAMDIREIDAKLLTISTIIS